MKTSFWSKFWPFLYYFSFYAALSTLLPYMALYYQGIGLTGGQIGLLTGLAPLITLVGAPLLTGMADASHRHRLVLSFSTLAVIACALAIPSIRDFTLLWGIVSLYTLVASPIVPLADSATMSMLGEQRGLYGRIRLGGTIGWGITAYFAGRFLDRQGLAWAYWIYAAGMAVNLLIAQGLRFGRVEIHHRFWSGIGALLSNRRWIFFLIMAFFCGVGMASINIYQFVYMAEIGANKSIMGLSLTISTLSELPVMFFGGWLLKRLKAQGLLTLSMIVIGFRLLLYSVFNFPGAILIIQLLHGLTFPAIWIAGVAYAYEYSPGGLAATGQGLFGAMMNGLGTAVGGFLGGLLIDAMGGRGMYLVFGATVLSVVLLLILIQRSLAPVPSTAD